MRTVNILFIPSSNIVAKQKALRAENCGITFYGNRRINVQCERRRTTVTRANTKERSSGLFESFKPEAVKQRARCKESIAFRDRLLAGLILRGFQTLAANRNQFLYGQSVSVVNRPAAPSFHTS